MIATDTQTREMATRMNVGLVYWYENKPDKAIELFESLLAEFESYGDTVLIAKLHNNIGIAYFLKAKLTGDHTHLNRTLAEYNIVKDLLSLTHDLPAIAIEDANIADALLTLGNLEQAHAYLDAAERTLTAYHDESLLGQTLETRARVYLAEGNLKEAWEAITRSEKLLMKGVEMAPMAETLQTKKLIEAARQSV